MNTASLIAMSHQSFHLITKLRIVLILIPEVANVLVQLVLVPLPVRKVHILNGILGAESKSGKS
jgi:hypothetical protein